MPTLEAEPHQAKTKRSLAPKIMARKLEDIPVDKLLPKEDQPRKRFRPEPLKRLADSMMAGSIVQPLVVRMHPARSGLYEILAGERRWRAAKMNSEKTVPCLIVWGNLNPYIISAVENFNREDLDPIEEAETYQRLRDDPELKMTLEEISQLMGKSLPVIIYKLRLLKLPKALQDDVSEGRLTQDQGLKLLEYQGNPQLFERFQQEIRSGKKPLILAANPKPLREKMSAERLADTAEDNFRRILRWGYGSAAAISAMRRFMTAPEAEQRRLWRQIPANSRASLIEHLQEASRESGKLHRMLSAFSA